MLLLYFNILDSIFVCFSDQFPFYCYTTITLSEFYDVDGDTRVPIIFAYDTEVERVTNMIEKSV